MATLSQGQVQAIAAAAGLPDPKLMAAIAMAESGGRTDAIGAVGEVGLWQINQPVHVRAHPSWTRAHLTNPINNAYAAKAILSTQGLSAWTAYTNGSYRRFYGGTNNAAVAAVDSAVAGAAGLIPNPLEAAGDVAGQLGRVAAAVAKAANWIASPAQWVRVAYVVVGGALVVGALLAVQVEGKTRLATQLVGVGAKFVGSKGKAVAR